MSGRRPHFIIGGAPRCATTWLYALLERHPEVAMARPVAPEPKFFLIDELYARGMSYYSATWFAPLPAGRCYGEKTTNYLESRVACERLARDLPDVALIFLLRDPVDRAYSNYLWSRRNGIETESFAQALEDEEARGSALAPELRYARPYAYFSRGLYADLLEPWLQRFPRDRVLVLRMEDVASQPATVSATVQRFLGVEQHADLWSGLGRVNAAMPAGSPVLDARLAHTLRERYREPNARLMRLLGSAFEGWKVTV